MSKTQKVKVDLDYTSELLEIITILRDVASNHFFSTAKRKQRFVEFAEAFIDFFRKKSNTNISLDSLENYPRVIPDEIREKIKESHIKRYGLDNPWKSSEVKEKIKQTNLKKLFLLR